MQPSRSNRPQNQHPDALVQSRKDAARRNYEAVCVTLQAMRQRGTSPQAVTVQAVAMESGVSMATIYRRDDLFTLIRKANPDLQRRQAEQIYREDLAHLRAALADARRDRDYHKKEAELTKIGSQGLKQEITQLRKKNLDLQREIARMKEYMASSISAKEALQLLHGIQKEPSE